MCWAEEGFAQAGSVPPRCSKHDYIYMPMLGCDVCMDERYASDILFECLRQADNPVAVAKLHNALNHIGVSRHIYLDTKYWP